MENLIIMKIKTVIHQVTFAAVGGIQTSFIPLYKLFREKSYFDHKIYGMHEVDSYYNEIKKYYINFSKSIIAKYRFMFFLISKKHIIHFYNNLGSKRIYYLLKFLPSKNIIYHERGTSWNASIRDIDIIKTNADNADVIIANSNAAKLILNKRFNINKNKIKVIYNGFISENFINKKVKRFSENFSIGYIGRLDTPKGVHVLIESAKKLPNFHFYIAGDGVLESQFKEMTEGYVNIKFMGRCKPIEFISKMDIIVVPSIREPLGNVIIEAGFCKKAVIATNIDGIPEIINNGTNGILLSPKNKLTIADIPSNAIPIPDFVVNPKKQKLVKPLEIDKKDLIESINFLKKDKIFRKKLGLELYKTVKKNFSLEKYFKEIHKVYNSF